MIEEKNDYIIYGSYRVPWPLVGMHGEGGGGADTIFVDGFNPDLFGTFGSTCLLRT